MHSLNQVNKLVSCGRDPARSLPLWRGFLLIPLILVCFAFAPQTRAVVPAPDGGYPGFNTAEGWQALQPHHRRICKHRRLVGSALFATTGASFNTGVGAGTLVLNQRMDCEHGRWHCLPCYSMPTAPETQLLERPRWSITQGDADGNGSFNGAFGAFALNS